MARTDLVAGVAAAEVARRLADERLGALETLGRSLARSGPTPAAMELVIGLLVERFGYEFVSIYMAESSGLVLAAQHGYQNPIHWFDGTIGVVSRVMRTHEVEFIPDASGDPDFIAATPGVRSEICVPLLEGRDLLGILNVESTAEDPLDDGDLRLLMAAGDRLAASLALARERQALAERAAIFARVTEFARVVASSLEPEGLTERFVRAVCDVLPVDVAAITLLDESAAELRITSLRIGDGRIDRIAVEPGQGVSGAVISRGERIIVDDTTAPSRGYRPLSTGVDHPASRPHRAVGLPLVGADGLFGALLVARELPARPFSALEVEVLDLLAAHTALALSNAMLHAEVLRASVTDRLTGVGNRAHFDAEAATLFGRRARLDPARRVPVSAILFDLDAFGEFNARHGHAGGDDLLRSFGRLLRERFRSTDIVARYGGEEFVAILDDCEVTAAAGTAEEIRRAFGALQVRLGDGSNGAATLSAGVAEAAIDDTSVEAVLRAADAALYEAKRLGRNRVVAGRFSPALTTGQPTIRQA